MKILSAEVENFGSYKHLKFNFQNSGLILISGATGSGKSTFCDILPWILFGRTAKDGAVDEVKAWGSTLPTKGLVYFDALGMTGVIHRVRGEAHENYLSLSIGDGTVIGKDLNDTQRRINEALGLTLETYLAAVYFHEFSQTAAFFTASAKNRRQITEQIADLSQVKKLSEAAKDYKKRIKDEKSRTEHELSSTQGQVSYLQDCINTDSSRVRDWEEKTAVEVKRLKEKYQSFDADRQTEIKKLQESYSAKESELRAQVQKLHAMISTKDYASEIFNLRKEIENLASETCKECGAPKNHSKSLDLTQQLYALEAEKTQNKRIILEALYARESLVNWVSKDCPTLQAIEQCEHSENLYETQLKELEKTENPYRVSLKHNQALLGKVKSKVETLEKSLESYITEVCDLALLQDVASSIRTSLLSSTMSYLEIKTNDYLKRYFDAELSIQFKAEDEDKLDVQVFKDGNSCFYTQLSKGQRQILKLCFGTSVMQVVCDANPFNVAFFDEALDGLDDTFKAKAYGLLEEISESRGSTFVVEHNEGLKSLFTNRYVVELTPEGSQLEKH